MKRDLIVVLGAGASFGSGISQQGGGKQPPLTPDLLTCDAGRNLRDTNYNQIKSLQLSFSEWEGTLEEFFTDLKVKADSDSLMKRRFLQLQLYLREMLYRCSGYQVSQGNAYAAMINILAETRKHFGRVCFITVNYDTLLESALYKVLDANINSIDAYLDFFDNWLLIKLHGSVSWGRAMTIGDGKSRMQLLDAINKDIPIQVEGPIIKVPQGNSNHFFPHLAVPLGEYEPICPEMHTEALHDALQSKQKSLLTIGFGAMDNDLMSLLNDTKFDSALIVGKDEDDARSIGKKFSYETTPFPGNFKTLVCAERRKSALRKFAETGFQIKDLKA